jgi:hypothetical protein
MKTAEWAHVQLDEIELSLARVHDYLREIRVDLDDFIDPMTAQRLTQARLAAHLMKLTLED